MHEYSLAIDLAAQVVKIARAHDGERVIQVVIEAGPLSGIEPVLLQSAFEQCTAATDLRGTQLTIQEVPLVIRCCDCAQVSSLKDLVFVCPTCGSGSVDVVSGDKLMLRHIELIQHAVDGVAP